MTPRPRRGTTPCGALTRVFLRDRNHCTRRALITEMITLVAQTSLVCCNASWLIEYRHNSRLSECAGGKRYTARRPACRRLHTVSSFRRVRGS